MENTVKYPIGVQSFEVLRKEGFVYVDKTDLVHKLAQQHVCFLCRPRRFGKSLTLSTLEAYFLGKKELFHGLKIMELEHDWKQYPVFHLDFNGVNFHKEGALDDALNAFVSTIEERYGKDPYTQDFGYGSRLEYALSRAHKQTGNRCVVLIDEYDKPMLDVLGEELEETNREILKGFYSVFKRADEHLRFVMLTGVTKFSQVSVFSGFNQPLDISMSREFEAICGITEDELTEYFSEPIAQMAQEEEMTIEDVRHWLKSSYDGYHFSDALTDIYNPFSLLNVFFNRSMRPYWFSTGSPTYLIKLLSNNDVNIQTILSKWYEVQYFIDYRANREDPLAMLYQSGYLTIKEVRRSIGEPRKYRLDFPNKEVKQSFITALSNNYFASREDAGGVVRDLVDSLKEGNLDEMRKLMTQYLSSIDYAMRKDKEYHFQYTLYLIFSLMSTYSVKIEQHNSQGRADLIVETSQYVYIFEFKLDGKADEALAQIEDKQYAKPYMTDKRQIIKVGASFGRKSGTIDDWKVG